MKRYSLICPKCNDSESITSNLAEPSDLVCSACEETIDLDEVREMIAGWQEYIKDYDEMLKHESEINSKEDSENL